MSFLGGRSFHVPHVRSSSSVLPTSGPGGNKIKHRELNRCRPFDRTGNLRAA